MHTAHLRCIGVKLSIMIRSRRVNADIRADYLHSRYYGWRFRRQPSTSIVTGYINSNELQEIDIVTNIDWQLWVGAGWTSSPQLSALKPAPELTTRLLVSISPKVTATVDWISDTTRILPHQRRLQGLIQYPRTESPR